MVKLIENRCERGPFLDSVRGMGVMSTRVEQRLGAAPPCAAVHGSAARSLLLEEWLWETTTRLDPLSETGFRRWLQGSSRAPMRTHRRVLHLRRRTRERVLTLWQERPDPVGEGHRLGSEFFLQAAACFAGLEVPAAYRFFSAFSSLDEGLGRASAGLSAALLARAVRESPYRAGFGAWFFNTGGRTLSILRRAAASGALGPPHGQWLERIEDLLVEGYEAGSAFRSAPEAGPFKGAPGGAAGAGSGEAGSDLAVDPAVFWRRLAFALGYGRQDLARSLGVLAPADPVDRRVLLVCGLLIGAWYGYEALRDRMEEDPRRAEAELEGALGIDPALRAEMFYELSCLQTLVLTAEGEPKAGSRPPFRRGSARDETASQAPGGTLQ